MRVLRIAAVALATAAAGVLPAAAQDNYEIKLVAGTPGYDHIQPFMAEYKGFWKKYGLNVNFISGNYQRSNQMISIGDFDAGYTQYASAIRYNSAGIENVIVSSSSANCAAIVASPSIEKFEDLKGKRIGIVTKFDAQYMTLVHHILPKFGLTMDDVQLAQVPVPEVASALLTGDIAAAFPFEPFATSAVDRGAKMLIPANELMDAKQTGTDMLRNGLIMTKKFVTEHPELAKRVVWAHLDAIQIMRTDKSVGMEVLKHYNPKMDVGLLESAYDSCGWGYNAPPKVWIETMIGWMREDGLIQNEVAYDSVVDLSMAESYPGYPAWEHLK